jgi:hypothetical protein
MPNRPAQPRPSLLRGFHLLNIERFAWPSSLALSELCCNILPSHDLRNRGFY